MTSAADLVRDLHAADATCARLGIEIVAAAEGDVTVALTVGPDDANALGMAHGGLVFTLADTAMQFACNSHGIAAVATGASIEFVRAAAVGDRLVAHAVEVSLRGKAGICDVTVVDAEGPTVALFRGRTLQIGSAPG